MITTTTKTDAELDRAVTQELDWDPGVDSKGIAVSVKHGVVTLGGFVASYSRKLAARDAAHSVAGVLDVADELQVQPGGMIMTDAELAQAIRRALVWNLSALAQRIRSTVSNGWVTLEGDVDFAYQRDDCERAIAHMHGVVEIHNSIKVIAQRVDPIKIRSAIENALTRRAHREAGAINITIDGTDVKLGGKVQSYRERHVIERVALNTPGVARVENSITVDPHG